MKNVVIVGGGFGGVMTAYYLLKSKQVHVTLISKSPIFTFIPLVPDLAAGYMKKEDITFSLLDEHNDRFTFVEDTVSSVDFAAKKVIGSANEYPYDTVVMAVGAQDNYFGTPGSEHTLSLKTLEDGLATQRLLNEMIATYEKTGDVADASFVIIGGGLTGVELACAIADRLRDSGMDDEKHDIMIVEGMNGILRAMSKGMQSRAEKFLAKRNIGPRLKQRVVAVSPGKVDVQDGPSFEGKAIFWTAGVMPVPVCVSGESDGTLGKGHFMCTKDLRIVGVQDAFALGDCSAVPDDTLKFVPKNAQAAMKEAKVVAQNILTGSSVSYTYKPDGYMMSLGDYNAVVDLGWFVFSGRLAAFFRKSAYKFRIWQLKRILRV